VVFNFTTGYLHEPFYLSLQRLLNFSALQLSPLCQYSATKEGFLTAWHVAHLGGIASRGPGLTFVEGTAVLSEGRITPSDSGIWSDDHIKPLADIVEFVHSQNQKIAIQLAHAGRKASTAAPWLKAKPTVEAEHGGWPDNVWGPSTVPFNDSYPKPQELTLEGIQKIVSAFADGAKRAVTAGFDVIEIHNAHGYLLNAFVSPISNKRTDQYGGSFENRIRLTVEVVDAVRAVIPENMPLFLRISATDWVEDVAPNEASWRSEDTVELAHVLADHGVDLIDVSTGGNDYRQKVKSGHQYQVPFAAAVKKSAGSKILVGAVGGLYSGISAQDVLETDRADVIFVGRQFQKNPGQVWAMAEELGVEIHVAHQIEWAFRGRGRKGVALI